MRELQSIAVVDDDPDILAIVELCLRDLAGFDVQIFESGEALLARLKDTGFDIVISDMMMPGMTGLDLLAEFKQMPTPPEFLLIFMTAKAQRHEVLSYKEAGAVDVVTKPFDPLTLADTISEIWRRNQQHAP